MRAPFKSDLQRCGDWFPAEQLPLVIDALLQGAVNGLKQLGLAEALDLEAYFLAPFRRLAQNEG
jgi:hypothetical protein